MNEKLTLDEYNTMALAVFNDKEDPSDVAGAFLERDGLTRPAATAAPARALIVGSKDFAGAQLLSQAYGQALAANGYDISYKDNIGPTETVYPLVKDGTIDLYGEFTGTFLTFLKGDADRPTRRRRTTLLTDEARRGQASSRRRRRCRRTSTASTSRRRRPTSTTS